MKLYKEMGITWDEIDKLKNDIEGLYVTYDRD